jgi:serine/threonine protein kinase
MSTASSIQVHPSVGATVLDAYTLSSHVRSAPYCNWFCGRSEASGDSVKIQIVSGDAAAVRTTRGPWRHLQDLVDQLQRTTHPNVQRVLNAGVSKLGDAEVFCIASESIEGETLHARIRAGSRLQIVDALMLGQQIAQGLAVLHRAGVVHGDLRATNVVLATSASNDGSEARPVLCDTGVTNTILSGIGSSPTLAGMMSAPEFIAPEQIRGEPAKSETDIYAFGMLLFRMISGVSPFTSGNNSQLLRAHLSQPAPRLRERCPNLEVPSQLEELVLKCVAKRATDRFDSIDSVLAKLQECEAIVLSIAANRNPSWMVPARSSVVTVSPLSRRAPRLNTLNAPPTPLMAESDLSGDASDVLEVATLESTPVAPPAPMLPVQLEELPSQELAPRTASARIPFNVAQVARSLSKQGLAPARSIPLAREDNDRHRAKTIERSASRSGSTPWSHYAIGAMFVAGVVGGYRFVSQDSSPPQPVDSPSQVVAALPSSPRSSRERVHFEVRSLARNAQIMIRGRVYPLPIEIELPAGNDPELVEVSAEGYTTRRNWIVLDQNMRTEINLAEDSAVSSPEPHRHGAPVASAAHEAPPSRQHPAAQNAAASQATLPTQTATILDSKTVTDVCRAHTAAVNRCLALGPAGAHVPIAFAIAPSGVVRSAAWTGNDARQRSVGMCLVSAIRSWTFPATGSQNDLQTSRTFSTN